MLKQLSDHFRKEVPLSVTQGKVHDYLGLTIDYSSKGKIKFYYVEQILRDTNPRHIKGATGPNLFKIADKAEKRTADTADQFNRKVAQLMFLSNREVSSTTLDTSLSLILN